MESGELIGFVADESGDTNDEADVEESTGEFGCADEDCGGVIVLLLAYSPRNDDKLLVIRLAAIDTNSAMLT